MNLLLYIFIDAFGWELYETNRWFLEGLINTKKPLRTVFGYSSACIPSIITGKTPAEHGHWSSFYYSPATSPFKFFRHLNFLPSAVAGNVWTRHYLSKTIKKLRGFSGYFETYNIPFKYLPYFDYQEKYDIFAEGGMTGSVTIFDRLGRQRISYFVGKEGADKMKFKRLNGVLDKGDIKFAYLHLGELDNLLHLNRKDSSIVKDKIREYDIQIMAAFNNARRHYNRVDLIVFSDHGMREVTSAYDLTKEIKQLNLIYGKDYAAFYDATMARFWFMNNASRKRVADRLYEIKEGRILSDPELESLGVYFKDRKYGEVIFLLNPGIMIVPSFMTRRALCGMHGYHPDDPDSYATYLASGDPRREPRTILDVFDF